MMRATAVLVAALAAALAISLWLVLGPLPAGAEPSGRSESLRIFDRNGILLYETLSGREVRSNWLEPASIPPLVEGATMAAEDHRFYSHNGIDPVAVARAAAVDIRSFSLREGGSTLTQQTAKRLINRRGSGIFGKLKEAVYALRLESRLTKKEIMALYLNVAPYGKNCEGIRKAAEAYFRTSPEKLTAAQCAFLASLPKAPTRLDPSKNPEGLKKRQERVLKRMRELGFVSEESYARAVGERITVSRAPEPFSAPHFVERVRDELPKGFKGNCVTTLDINLQGDVQRIINSNRKLLEKIGAGSAAVVILDNRSGEWLAWEGSGCYGSGEAGGSIDGVVAPRQPGSALKPFLYAMAFEGDLTSASILPDIPQAYGTQKEGAYYKPRNYDNKFRGPLSARRSLAGSVNVPAVYLLSRIGVDAFIERLKSGGITTIDKSADYYGYGLALGNAEVRLDELAALYSALARGGSFIKPVKLAGKQREEARRLFSYESCYLVADVLSDPRAREFAFGRNSVLDFPYAVAAKTGTSEGYRDNWAFGYDRDITVGVWVGNFDRRPLKYSSGVSGAGPIFHEIMEEAVLRTRGMEPPPEERILQDPGSLKKVELCSLSGGLAGEACPSMIIEELPQDKIPEVCEWHIRHKGRTYARYPQPFDEWARSMGLYREIPEDALAGASREEKKEFAISSPLPSAVFLFDPTLKAPYQGVYLESMNGKGEVSWSIDGKPFRKAKSGAKTFWPFTRGEHRIEARDSDGKSDSVKVFVR